MPACLTQCGCDMAYGARPVSGRSALKGWGALHRRALAECAARGTELTPLREAVLAELWEAGSPLGAYELSARISDRKRQRIAPNSVYRILDLLQSIALVRRVESMHAYYLVEAESGSTDILLMCNDCGGVTAIGTGDIRTAIASRSEAAGFHPVSQVVEVAGRCHDCDAKVTHG